MKRRKINADAIFEQTKALNAQYKTVNKSYRREIYKLMGDAQAIIVKIISDKLQSSFQRGVEKRRNGPTDGKFKVSLEVMSLIMGASSRSQRQLASKRGRVLEILRRDGVSAKNTASTISKRGGIERILRDDSQKNIPIVGQISAVSKKEPANQKQALNAATNGNDVDVLVYVYMRLSDRDSIQTAVSGATVKLTGIVINQKRAAIKVRSVRFI